MKNTHTIGEKIYEAGVDQGVLYKMSGSSYGKGVAWNGLTAVNESPSGAEENKHYADNIKYASILSAEDFGFTIEAFTSPKEFDQCDGTAELATGVTVSQQSRKPFGFSYRTQLASDVAEIGEGGAIIHLDTVARLLLLVRTEALSMSHLSLQHSAGK